MFNDMNDAPDMSTPAGRLKFLRELRGHESAEQFALFAGVKGVTYRTHESGERGIGRKVGLYAKKLKTSEEWLQFGRGNMNVETSSDERNPMDNVHVLDTLKVKPANNGMQDFVNISEQREGVVPVHASIPGPGKGWLMLSNPSYSVDALPELSKVAIPRGYIMPSDEMDPVIVIGEVLYPHPDKPAKNRSIVMIWLKKYPNEWFARELISRDEDGSITVRKYGIDKESGDPVTSQSVIEWDDVKEMTVTIRER